ncbi:AbrB/MazE/SpoVT family DNA-binding domain-containing protein [Staphylococcus pseudintermedius]|nr:AbrB/MazE/SpoVT family DNA-binding domain-containing protein [Staphylococcus pseudintermedius]EGQ3991735.1 AbrB/MazE/SpoVT family DNA-binding domain-containing protein [Staphylococcus pseudintermedius]EGQ4408740.1 AbrB/MazE/SpoVT family DNA-binding domain-containing protein [Staphylococcus pseudintermedius]
MLYNVVDFKSEEDKTRLLRREEPESIITFHLTYTCIRIYNYYDRKYIRKKVVLMAMVEKDLKRKVRKVGNSATLSIPNSLLERVGIKVGEEVSIKINEDGNIELEKHVDREKEVIAKANKVFAQYNKTMKDLVQR